jgi:hypothetical protein
MFNIFLLLLALDNQGTMLRKLPLGYLVFNLDGTDLGMGERAINNEPRTQPNLSKP